MLRAASCLVTRARLKPNYTATSRRLLFGAIAIAPCGHRELGWDDHGCHAALLRSVGEGYQHGENRG
jgi:hypothetical protein